MSIARKKRNYFTQLGLAWLVIAQLSLGLARISIVPLGFNVDELFHYWSAKTAGAACLRSLLGQEWTIFFHEEVQLGGDAFEVTGPNNPEAAPCSVLFADPLQRGLAYYLWAGAPMAALDSLTDRLGVNVGRSASLLLGLLVTVLAYHTMLVLFPKRTMLAFGTAVGVGLNQHFNDIMTGVNTDVGATFIVTFLIWNLAHLHATGLTRRHVFGVLLALGLSLVTKTTAWVGFPITLLWLWIKLPRSIRWGSLIGAALIAVIGLLIQQPFKDSAPAYWYVANDRDAILLANRRSRGVPLGNYSLGLRREYLIASEERFPGLVPIGIDYVQYLSEAQVRQLRGQQVTFGGWIWAPKGSRIAFPAIEVGERQLNDFIVGTGTWRFHAYSTTIPPDIKYIAFLLNFPYSNMTNSNEIYVAQIDYPYSKGTSSNEIYYDGLFFIAGKHDISTPPQFDTPDATTGLWGDRNRFVNLLQNPSVEQMWPVLDFGRIPAFIPNVNLLFWSLLSWERTGTAWFQIPGWILGMFWSGFAGVSPGLSRLQLLPFAVISAIAALGVLGALFNRRILAFGSQFSRMEKRAILLLAGTAALIWLLVILRAEIYPNRSEMFAFLGVRHGLTGIVPTMGLFTVGLLYFVPRRNQRWVVAGLSLLFFATSLYILLGVQIPSY